MPARKTTEQMIEVMQAFADGKTIQYRLRNKEGNWWDIKEPMWAWDTSDYRVKPEVNPVHAFEVGDMTIPKKACNGDPLQESDIEAVIGVKPSCIELAYGSMNPDELIKVDDVLWYWEYRRNAIWYRTAGRFIKEELIKFLSEYGATNLTPLYVLGARLPESEAKDD